MSREVINCSTGVNPLPLLPHQLAHCYNHTTILVVQMEHIAECVCLCVHTITVERVNLRTDSGRIQIHQHLATVLVMLKVSK